MVEPRFQPTARPPRHTPARHAPHARPAHATRLAHAGLHLEDSGPAGGLQAGPPSYGDTLRRSQLSVTVWQGWGQGGLPGAPGPLCLILLRVMGTQGKQS